MRNYVEIGPKYRWHFADEDDRAWLTETLADSPNYNANMAIALNKNLDENAPMLKFSRIFSDSEKRILWVAQSVNRANGMLVMRSIAIHPSLRDQGYVRDIGNEEFPWLDTNKPWGVKKFSVATEEQFNTGETLFPNFGFQDSIFGNMKNTIRRIG